MQILKRLSFFWFFSFTFATAIYYGLWLIMSDNQVFGSWFRMFPYHSQHPLMYVAIPCFFYGILATVFSNRFHNAAILGRIMTTLTIIVLTILLSSPFGGMLWHYHDMQAGYFPDNWTEKMITNGITWGLEMGWLIVLLSIPYNIIGSIICYFLTQKGAELFRTSYQEPSDHHSLL